MRTTASSALQREYNRTMATTEFVPREHSGSKRFVRPGKMPELNITPRNLALLAYVAKHRLISSDDLARLDGGSAQNVKRELRRMWESGYILRPTAQTRTIAITGPQPMVYGMSNKGARLLRDHGHLINLDSDFSENCRRAGITFIDHGVAQSRFMTAIEIAQRNRSDITLVDAAAIIACAPEKTRRAKHRLKWTAAVPDGRGGEAPASLVSDDLFALMFGDGTASYFLVEIDRGQMPVRRHAGSRSEVVNGKRRLRTYYKHKLASYYHGWRQRRHVEQFGIEQIRVLTVTTSQKRIETMLDALSDVTKGKGSELFLFIDEERLRSTNPLDAEWITGKGNLARLTD
jgi:Replication-relaxation